MLVEDENDCVVFDSVPEGGNSCSRYIFVGRNRGKHEAKYEDGGDKVLMLYHLNKNGVRDTCFPFTPGDHEPDKVVCVRNHDFPLHVGSDHNYF